MKKLFLLSISAFFVIGCGSSDTKSYVISDDHNGTKSPRIKSVLYHPADNNKSLETITQYTYDSNNLLISKKMSYTKSKDDIKELTFTYNDKKQYATADLNNFNVGIDRGGHYHEFFYGDILDNDTKLPIITLEITYSHSTYCHKEYIYNLNNQNYAKSIDKIETTCSGVLITKLDYINTFEYNKNGMIKTITQTINDKHITYTSFQKIHEITWSDEKYLYLYNKDNLLTSIEKYHKLSDTGTYVLVSTQTLNYENKKYHYSRTPNSIDFGLYESYDNPFIYLN